MGVLWVLIQLAMPVLIQLSLLVAVLVGYLLRRTITRQTIIATEVASSPRPALPLLPATRFRPQSPMI